MKQITPTLFFTGEAEEVLEFYRSALGGKVDVNRYKDAPDEARSGIEWDQKVMYGTVTSAYGVIAAMDAPPGRAGDPGDRYGITIIGDDDDAMRQIFDKLAQGARRITMPYEETFFASKFGMLTDKYGVNWLVNSRLVASPSVN